MSLRQEEYTLCKRTVGERAQAIVFCLLPYAISFVVSTAEWMWGRLGEAARWNDSFEGCEDVFI